MRGKSLMVMGTASSVGKSVLCSAFLRIMKQDGYKVAPFKAQNMALNSFVTKDGLEMGRAQVTQAQAAGVEPDVRMNPVLLKPTSDRRSQVIVDGKAIGTMTAMEYHCYKPALRERIKATYDALESTVDCVVIEGAGSPAEINLRAGDIVNMSMAESADAPVVLVGDINLGGVFASLLGTVMLLTDEERARVKGVIINKFRGDVKILEPGLKMLEERIHIPVLGVVPWMDVGLEDEDSVTERFSRMMGQGDLDVAVVKLKHISNFTDFQSLSLQPGVKVRYAQTAKEVENADLIVLPGTKNTIEDLIDLRNRGLDAAIPCSRCPTPACAAAWSSACAADTKCWVESCTTPTMWNRACRSWRVWTYWTWRSPSQGRRKPRRPAASSMRPAGWHHRTAFWWTATRFTPGKISSAKGRCRGCASAIAWTA